MLKLELAEYLEHKELEKLETTRMREDMAEIQPMAKGRLDHTWIGYYQRQILQRMEAFTESKKRNPLKQGISYLYERIFISIHTRKFSRRLVMFFLVRSIQCC